VRRLAAVAAGRRAGEACARCGVQVGASLLHFFLSLAEILPTAAGSWPVPRPCRVQAGCRGGGWGGLRPPERRRVVSLQACCGCRRVLDHDQCKLFLCTATGAEGQIVSGWDMGRARVCGPGGGGGVCARSAGGSRLQAGRYPLGATMISCLPLRMRRNSISFCGGRRGGRVRSAGRGGARDAPQAGAGRARALAHTWVCRCAAGCCAGVVQGMTASPMQSRWGSVEWVGGWVARATWHGDDPTSLSHLGDRAACPPRHASPAAGAAHLGIQLAHHVARQLGEALDLAAVHGGQAVLRGAGSACKLLSSRLRAPPAGSGCRPPARPPYRRAGALALTSKVVFSMPPEALTIMTPSTPLCLWILSSVSCSAQAALRWGACVLGGGMPRMARCRRILPVEATGRPDHRMAGHVHVQCTVRNSPSLLPGRQASQTRVAADFSGSPGQCGSRLQQSQLWLCALASEAGVPG